MLPKGLDGILVTGLGLSAHTDAIPSIRMQPCMQNLGYAAGRAAAMAAELNGRTRDIDIKALQKQLVREKCLSPDVPHHRDSFPLPEATVQHAVSTLIQRGYSGFDVLLVDPGISIPMLREAYATPSSGRAGRLRCAHVLGMLGDATGVQTLIETVEEFRELDRDRIDTYFPWVTWLGSYMIALGRTRHPDALQPLLDKLALLQRTEDPAASHYRAVTLALDALGDPRAAPALARLLQSGRLGGEPITQLATPGKAKRDKGGRGKLLLAGTLYRLGDHEGLGRAVLTAFTQDLRGNYARYARVALRQGNAGK